ncbi:hypothetical protein PIB30_099917 [Stylosanthes scabra]|uniref:Uncharacterized protein n=1 Tax=Stylosanthes scabra TaxID=79078 RepID=A0ABU6UVX4_9FABA|nr:hypothetical protein [Stylosanthes scabra]
MPSIFFSLYLSAETQRRLAAKPPSRLAAKLPQPRPLLAFSFSNCVHHHHLILLFRSWPHAEGEELQQRLQLFQLKRLQLNFDRVGNGASSE